MSDFPSTNLAPHLTAVEDAVKAIMLRQYRPEDLADRFPQAMVEATTEFDWAELPEHIKDVMRDAARKFSAWADPIQGETVSARDLLGIAPDFTGGLSVDEYMDEQRGRGEG